MENYPHDHIPFNFKGNENLFLRVHSWSHILRTRFPISFKLKGIWSSLTVFLLIINPTEFRLVHNHKENFHCDHISFNLKGIRNPVLWSQGFKFHVVGRNKFGWQGLRFFISITQNNSREIRALKFYVICIIFDVYLYHIIYGLLAIQFTAMGYILPVSVIFNLISIQFIRELLLVIETIWYIFYQLYMCVFLMLRL